MWLFFLTFSLDRFCAHEFEKLKDMGAASLAYKCMEVAYMRVIYSSQTSASRDRHELQTALQSVPLGNEIYDVASCFYLNSLIGCSFHAFARDIGNLLHEKIITFLLTKNMLSILPIYFPITY